MFFSKHFASKVSWALVLLSTIFFVSGFTALLYQVVWQRVLGLFSGSDVRSVTIVVASYLAGLGLGSLLGGWLSDRLSRRRAVEVFGFSNLAIAVFAVFSRFLFYDLLFIRLRLLAESPTLLLPIVFISLLIPTSLMGLSLPLLSKAISGEIERAAARIGLLYGINTLGSGLGTLISGWYLIGTLGYEKTIYLGAFLSALVGLAALISASLFKGQRPRLTAHTAAVTPLQRSVPSIRQWYVLVLSIWLCRNFLRNHLVSGFGHCLAVDRLYLCPSPGVYFGQQCSRKLNWSESRPIDSQSAQGIPVYSRNCCRLLSPGCLADQSVLAGSSRAAFRYWLH
ncbi:fused MFS/spermidine synthase [Kovacikia minuta CCNUW1]|uniref:fused MFS/spermidine synthase n=1 Tax=Kovacikia minuta TaxID=2931930 RepID=UPI001CCAAE4B|nr:fused MFS/spermidine synthase [Kovacikia minuta]UBF27066.1 fused MFS/spermidine synthase [Kovacikia minuta CCNUW1]